MNIDIQENTVTITYEQSDTIGRSFLDEIKLSHPMIELWFYTLETHTTNDVLMKRTKNNIISSCNTALYIVDLILGR